MVAYNFQARFAKAVASGQKRQTIRAPRKGTGHAKPGDRLQLYTGMGPKACRKICEAICCESCAIRIEHDRVFVGPQEIDTSDGLDRLARSDGFASWAAMGDWFRTTYGLPFQGHLIRWAVENKSGQGASRASIKTSMP